MPSTVHNDSSVLRTDVASAAPFRLAVSETPISIRQHRDCIAASTSGGVVDGIFSRALCRARVQIGAPIMVLRRRPETDALATTFRHHRRLRLFAPRSGTSRPLGVGTIMIVWAILRGSRGSCFFFPLNGHQPATGAAAEAAAGLGAAGAGAGAPSRKPRRLTPSAPQMARSSSVLLSRMNADMDWRD